MPNKTQHLKISKIYLGEGNPLIHQILDSSSLLVGSKHREHSHTLFTIQWIEKGFGEKGRREAILHILADAGIVNVND